MAATAGRNSRRFKRLAANVRARRRPCCLCGQPIDYTLRHPHPDSFTVEHIQDWATHPHLREDPGNLEAAHLRCNSAQKSQAAETLGQRSREW